MADCVQINKIISIALYHGVNKTRRPYHLLAVRVMLAVCLLISHKAMRRLEVVGVVIWSKYRAQFS